MKERNRILRNGAEYYGSAKDGGELQKMVRYHLNFTHIWVGIHQSELLSLEFIHDSPFLFCSTSTIY